MNNYNISEILDSFFPEVLKGHPQYKVLIDLSKQEFSKIDEFIRMISIYSNIDRCPEEFIQHIGDIIGFQYNKDLDIESQRECMKLYTQEISMSMGRAQDIQTMATYGDNEGYLGGGIFIPGTYNELPLATVVMAREEIYTHSKSIRSGLDKYPSEVFREGVLLITVTRLNDKIKNRVEQVKPAGILAVYQIADAYGQMQYITHTKN